VNASTRRRAIVVAVPAVLVAVLLGVRLVEREPEPALSHDRAGVEREPDERTADPVERPDVSVALVAAASPAPSTGTPPVAAATLDEGELMLLLRSARGNDPKLAVELAREGNRRFPSGADAPERASILIHALAELGLASQARGEAEDMVNRYPDSAWVREIERFTGAHRHRNVYVDAQGQLRYTDPTSPR
jgi:hypothetical protein